MNKIISTVSFILIFACFFSCESDLDKTQVEIKTAPTSLSTNLTTPYICSSENAEEVAMTVSWNKADFGNNIPCSYVIMFDVKGGDFSNPAEIITANNAIRKDILSDELNTIMHKLGRPIDVPTELDMKVLARPAILGSSSPNLPSMVTDNSVTINITSFAMAPMHLCGAPYSYTASYAWSTSNFRYVMFRDDPLGLDMFITRFVNGYGEFKFIPNGGLGSWNGSYGKMSQGVLNPAGGSNIDDLKTMETGYYTVVADFNKLTYTVTPYDDAGAPTFTEITVKGTAVSSPVNFIRLFDKDANGVRNVELDPHLWYVLEVDLTPGTLYFESNTGKKWGGETFPWGKYIDGKESIDIPKAGKYFIRFFDMTGHYVFYKLP